MPHSYSDVCRTFAVKCSQATLERTAIIAVLLALAIGFAIGRYKARAAQYAIQNRGEVRLSRAVKTRFRPPDYHLLNHITLRLKDGTTQVDHILVSRFVVFVIASLRKLQFPLDRLEARLFTQRIKERINL